MVKRYSFAMAADMNNAGVEKVRVLVNPRSGVWATFAYIRRALDRHWDQPGTDLTYQFCQSKQDSTDKARRALDEGVDTVLVAGGDGTINTIAQVLIDTPATLGVIPTGSGNGFARHFDIPLQPGRAVRALREGRVRTIDVGEVDGFPFLVTCSMAWDASLVKAYEKSPVRGILPYLFAGVGEFFQYERQDVTIRIDEDEEIRLRRPMVLTVANLTQFGGGAQIAPDARADDGYLALVVGLEKDMHRLLPNITRLFDGSMNRVPELKTWRFRTLEVQREKAADIQMDGELVQKGPCLTFRVRPSCLRVLVPGNT